MTPVEFNAFLRARAEKLKEDMTFSQINIYSLAALIRNMIWSKHPITLDRAFPDAVPTIPQREEMSDDDMYRQVVILNRLFGGKEV
jgi:hypothetical protein